jgi:hypothetical protein
VENGPFARSAERPTQKDDLLRELGVDPLSHRRGNFGFPVLYPAPPSEVRLWLPPGHLLDGRDAILSSGTTAAVLSAKDDRITRLAVLKAAAEFAGLWGQTRAEVKSEHVLAIANKWLEWVEAE